MDGAQDLQCRELLLSPSSHKGSQERGNDYNECSSYSDKVCNDEMSSVDEVFAHYLDEQVFAMFSY